ncbi:two-partner secretion domain-containing protein [Nostoc sp. UHCC 0870]|uniref:two-partner secretion domain-containing protein n=1 Tax=Nostoc sp. UHCC 0870 TaxID=2914041 RepID=UPI001EDFD301|nr:filamentous hemagglutinin N-terminal domain-containing protein [Nostoc sp. UHCC 0870]UKO95861.1 filamentous hemagglutinin N-terminal domain-containing protein [Nostoc sp. UHCC 0870]
MYQSRSDRHANLRLVSALTIASISVFFGDCTLAQITKDDTLGAENSVVTPNLINGQNVDQIDGGAIRGNNLFHSFEQFSVSPGNTAYFNNATNIQNIIGRVTGNSISNINGIIKTNGTANLFLINPNGIIFGSQAALDIQGSFLASTATSINFGNNLQFSAVNPQTAPLLSIDVPIGLQFGTTAATIRNQSQASLGGATNRLNRPAGLQVQANQTLALVGGDLTLESGNLTAKSGRIELGSVGANSVVSINPTNQGWVLGYENVRDFQNVQLTRQTLGTPNSPSQVDVSGAGSGSIHVQGKQVLINSSSQLLANTLGSRQGGNLTINASESVELVSGTPLTTRTFGSGNAGDLTITTGKLIVKDLAQVQTGAQFLNNVGALRLGSGGKLIVNASDSVELSGSRVFGNFLLFTGLLAATPDSGDAGDIIINTKNLRIEDGARISTESAGRLQIVAGSNQFSPATGRGGNVIINASESVQINGTSANNSPSGIFTATRGIGAAGNLTLTTKKLTIQDGGAIIVSSAAQKNVIYLGDPTQLGAAGEININARFIHLDQGKLVAESEAGRGGNINLKVQDLLLMRHESQISTNAGQTLGQGDGGNIAINAANGFIVGFPLENSDITANAFAGTGGKVTINAKNIFGFVPRTRAELVELLGTENPEELNASKLPTNDITAFSQQNPSLNGDVEINTPDVDPSQGLVELPTNVVEASRQIASICHTEKKTERSSFITTGRGGVTPNPTDTLTDDAVLADWIKLPVDHQENGADNIQRRKEENTGKIKSGDRLRWSIADPSSQIIEAQGWVIDPNGNIVLVAQAPTVKPHSTGMKSADCSR